MASRWGSPKFLPGVVYKLVGLPALSFHLPRRKAKSDYRLHHSGGWGCTTLLTVRWETWWASVISAFKVRQSSLSTSDDSTLTSPGSRDISGLCLLEPREQLVLPWPPTLEYWLAASSILKPPYQISVHPGSLLPVPRIASCLFLWQWVSAWLPPFYLSETVFCSQFQYDCTWAGGSPVSSTSWFLPVVRFSVLGDRTPSVTCLQVWYTQLLSSVPHIHPAVCSDSPQSLPQVCSSLGFCLFHGLHG